jgi:hypothetical protein
MHDNHSRLMTFAFVHDGHSWQRFSPAIHDSFHQAQSTKVKLAASIESAWHRPFQ